MQGSGGGGGSSFVAPEAIQIGGSRDHSGNGEVTITHDPSTDSCTEPPPPPPGPDGADGADGAAGPGAQVAVVAQPRFTG
jgi:hypothetical protein